MTHELAKLILKYGHKFTTCDEATDMARFLGMPETQIAEQLASHWPEASIDAAWKRASATIGTATGHAPVAAPAA